MLRINLPVGGIEVLIDEKGRTGTIRSNLHTHNGSHHYIAYDAAVSAIESLVLNHACSGVPVKGRHYVEGLEATINVLKKKYA